MTQESPPLSRLHIVEPNEAVQQGLLRGLRENGCQFTAATVSTQWLAMNHWDFEPSTVVVRAAIRDVWPALLKVRALRALNCRPIVLLDCETYPAARIRLLAAGADSVVDTDDGLQAAVQATQCALEAEGFPAPRRTREALPVISDRSLQLAALYTSAFSPTAPQLGRALGISAETVRTHLERVRAQYRKLPEVGARAVDVSSRAGLREALRRDGQVVGESGWYE